MEIYATDRFRRLKVVIFSVLWISLLCTGKLFGQGAGASILGVTSDSSGATIAQANVVAKNLESGASRTATSDEQGRYTIPELAVGDYEITASKTGFATVLRKGINLTVGAQAVVDFSLPVGQQTQTVTVEAQVSQVETSNSTVASLIDQKQMAELPLNGRNFEQLILLSSGVQAMTATQAAGFVGRASSYSVSGGRPEGQALLLDDESMQNFWNRGLASVSGNSLGVEAIGEFQTLTNTYGSQYGGNGAVINAVSKSGSNAFHGSAFDFLRNSAFDARNFFEVRKNPGSDHADPAPFRKNQFGGSLGGPVKKDKLFFFADYEGVRQLLTVSNTAFVPAANNRTVTATNPVTAQAITNALALYPFPDAGTVNPATGVGTSQQVGSQVDHENYVLARFDYNASSKDSILGRYVSSRSSFVDPLAGGGAALPLWPETDTSNLQFSTLQWRRVLSPTMLNVARVSFSRPETDGKTTGSTSPLQFFPGTGRQDGTVNITGITGLGSPTFPPFVLIQNRFTEADDFLWTKGSHSLRFGAAVSRLQTNTRDSFREGGTYAFNSLALFLSGTAFTFTGVPLNPVPYDHRDWRHIEFTPYFQDDWKIGPKLVVNLGVRWSFMTNPTEIHGAIYAVSDFINDTTIKQRPNNFIRNPSWGNIDPRIGFAYDVFGDHKTSIRGGFGMFHDPILPGVYAAGFWTNPPWSTFQITNPNYPGAFAGATLTPPKPTSSPAFDYNTATTPYMIQYNLNVQRELGSGTVLSVGYVGSKGVHLMTGIERNPTTATKDANGVWHFTSVRVNQNLGPFPTLAPISSSRYNSLQASLNRRLSRNVQAQANYTYSRCIDNGSFYASLNSNSPMTVANPYDQSYDKGVCSFDITHTLRVNGVVTLPFKGNKLVEGWQISGITTASSGLPFNISTGFDRVGYQGSGTPRPNVTAGCDPNAGGGTAEHWFNTSCYTLQAQGTMGSLGRDTGRGDNFFSTDIAVLKDTRIPKISEAFRVQFRAEAFNLFNHTNFSFPNAAIFTASGANPQAGRVTSIVGTSRQLQFAVKFLF